MTPGDGLAILVPVLRRPHRVRPVLDSINQTVPGARVLFITDPDDVEEQHAIRKHRGEALTVAGNYASKINAGADATLEPLLFLAADDLRFHAGWFEAVVSLLTGRVQVVGTNDLCNRRVIRGEHSTHSLVTRGYITEYGTIDEPGKALHEGYPHEFVDDEFVQTAQARGMYAHAHDAIVEHLHPMIGKAPFDATYMIGLARRRQSARVFRRRRRLWTSL